MTASPREQINREGPVGGVNRRGFLGSLALFVAAPAIVKASSLMPVRSLPAAIEAWGSFGEYVRMSMTQLSSTITMCVGCTANGRIDAWTGRTSPDGSTHIYGPVQVITSKGYAIPRDASLTAIFGASTSSVSLT